jgi:hypothetical protein
MKAQGTELYFLDPDDCSVVTVGCPTSITGLDSTIDQNETTCLSSTSRTYEAGLATPGTASFTINFDSQDPSHERLLELKQAGTTLTWAIGFSDGTGIPPTGGTDSAGDCVFTLPDTRTWIVFDGFMNGYSFDFALNSQVTSTVGIQVSGDPDLTPKAAS